VIGTLHKAGDRIGSGRYEVVQYIGAGGMQEVYEANDRLLARTVALKAPKTPSAAKRFKRSAVASARVNHANVAKTLDYVEERDRAYLIEEFILGKDLGRVLEENFPKLDPLMVARIFHRLAKGVAASHHAGVIHRDLKPSNIMAVGGERLEEIKITDFGIAKMAEEELVEAWQGGDDSITASQTAIGALPYMAPEMIRAMRDARQPADVWSLGALMFELLTGEKPFGTGLGAVPAILEAKIPEVGRIGTTNLQFKSSAEELYQIIISCLKSNPAERPTADELVSKCESLCYPISNREFGTVYRFDNRYWGFISSEQGDSVFFHINSVYGDKRIKVGDRVWYARHMGGGADRAFPVVKLTA
jgi:eukaryotic-like serine/threonine-protein kinase